MKSFYYPLIIVVLFFTNCSEEVISIDNNIEVDIQKRSNYDCVQNATCDLDYDFPIKGPGSYNCFTVTFDTTLTIDEIFCLEQAYFKCFPSLKKSIIQPSDPYIEMWCLPTDKSINPISTTMDSDPRVDDGG